MNRSSIAVALAFVLLSSFESCSSAALASPWAPPARAAPRERAGAWVALAGFTAQSGARAELGAMLVLGFALDRIFASGPVAPRPAYAQGPSPPLELPIRPLLTPGLARAAVQASWRAVGLGADDARIESMIHRSKIAALLPETRLRAMRVLDDRASADFTTDSATARNYDSTGARLALEARLTWRLDRLVYADDEPSLERIRMDHHDARMKLAGKVLEALFAWQRAWLDADSSGRGTREELDAVVKAIEAEATLDVLTAGWFATWRATHGPPAGR